jgi:capsular polysaccharide biosynthesis protein
MECVADCEQAFRNGVIAPPPSAHLGGAGEGEEASIQHLIAILARRRRMIATMVVCGTLLLALAASLISPVFTAFAQVGVISPSVSAGPEGTDRRASQMIVDTHMVLLKSRDFLREVLVSLDQGAEAAPAREFAHRLEEFERRLTISQSLSSGVISVAYTSKNAEEAAKVANRIVTLYRVQLGKREDESLQTEFDWLRRRLAAIDHAGTEMGAQIQARLLELSKASPLTPRDSNEQLGKLEMEARANAQLQVNLLRRHKARQQLEAPPQQIWIVSLAAAPVTPSSLPRWLLVIPGGVLLLIGSCFGAIASEQLDQRLRGASDVTSALSMPCIGLVPRVPRSRFWRARKRVDEQPFTPYTESIRSIAAALGVGAPSHSPKIVLLSRCEPAEDMTRVAVSVAHYAAGIGRRVLLVDLDARTPGVLRELGLGATHDVVDVVDLVLNDAAPQTVIRKHPVLAFDYLPMKASRIDPLTLLACGRLQRALHAFREDYDLIFIAGPPAPRPEAPLLAAMSDKVLLFLKWGATRGATAQGAARALRGGSLAHNGPPVVMAAVVTEVPSRGAHL